MFRKKLLPYSADLHNGERVWHYAFSFGATKSKIWITCDGQRVDLRPQGYLKPYLLDPDTAWVVLESFRRVEALA